MKRRVGFGVQLFTRLWGAACWHVQNPYSAGDYGFMVCMWDSPRAPGSFYRETIPGVFRRGDFWPLDKKPLSCGVENDEWLCLVILVKIQLFAALGCCSLGWFVIAKWPRGRFWWGGLLVLLHLGVVRDGAKSPTPLRDYSPWDCKEKHLRVNLNA